MAADRPQDVNEDEYDDPDAEFLDLDDEGLEVVDDGAAPEMSDEEDGDEDEEDEEEEEGDVPMEPAKDDSIACFNESSSAIHVVCQHPTKPLLVCGGEDDNAYLLQYPECTKLFTLSGHEDTIVDACFTFDGSFVATAGMDGEVKLWNVETGELHVTLSGLSDGAAWVISHPKGGVIFAGDDSGQCAMWNLKGDPLQMFMGHADKVTCGMLSADNKQLITGSADGSVRVWNPKTGESVHTFDRSKGLPEEEVTAIATHPKNAELILAGFADGTLASLSLSNGKVFKQEKWHSEPIESIAFCEPFPLFATSSTDNKLIIWDMNTQQPRNTLTLPEGLIKAKWHGENLMCVSVEGVIRMLDGRSADLSSTKEWTGHGVPILDFCVSNDGQHIISAGDDNTVRVFAI